MKTIDNFPSYIEGAEGRHLLFTGTFDPIHNGHLGLIKKSVGRTRNPLILNPHNGNPTKHKTRSDMAARLEWIELALAESGLLDEVILLGDSKNGPLLNHIIAEKFRPKVFKVIGSDKFQTSGCISLCLGEKRKAGFSSSAVKPLLNAGDYEEAEKFMPSSVVAAIRREQFRFEV